MKALNNDLDDLGLLEALDRINYLAETIKLTDLIDPSSKVLGMTAELIRRVQNLELRPVDMGQITYGGEA